MWALVSNNWIAVVLDEANVGNSGRTNVLDTVIVTGARAKIVEESLAATEQDRHHYEMHFIDEPTVKVLPDGGCAAADQNIKVTCCFKS